MDHQNATESLAAERYVLDEMTPDEREDFESHFFDCLVCANAVRDGSALVEGGRRLVRANNVVEMAPRRAAKWRWVPAAAAAMLLAATIGYQFPRDQAPAIEASGAVLLAESRGGAVKAIRAGEATSLNVMPIASGYNRYWCEVRDASGKAHFQREIPVDPNEGTVTVTIRANALRPGAYTLIVAGIGADGRRSDTENLRFDVEGP